MAKGQVNPILIFVAIASLMALYFYLPTLIDEVFLKNRAVESLNNSAQLGELPYLFNNFSYQDVTGSVNFNQNRTLNNTSPVLLVANVGLSGSNNARGEIRIIVYTPTGQQLSFNSLQRGILGSGDHRTDQTNTILLPINSTYQIQTTIVGGSPTFHKNSIFEAQL